jgi:hypothetical protein
MHASSHMVTTLNEGRDVIKDGSLSWVPESGLEDEFGLNILLLWKKTPG